MLQCKPDQQYFRKYAYRTLTQLYQSAEKFKEVELELACIEGAILEIELLWTLMLGETPPLRRDILNKIHN